MRLHRYFGSHADTTLRDKRLLLAKVSDFNDPFEFAHRFTGEYTVDYAEIDLGHMPDEEVAIHLSTVSECLSPESLKESTPRRQLAEVFVRSGNRPPVDIFYQQRLADEFFRICCFSKTDVTPDSEILLWSHYARHHRGVRIEFDFDERRFPLAEVDYSSHRCAIDFSRAYEGDHTNEILRRAMHTKSTAWSYEKEVRLILKKDFLQSPTPKEGDLKFLPFDASCVRAVDFGINCDESTVQAVTEALSHDYSHVAKRKAFHHPEDYAIEYRPI